MVCVVYVVLAWVLIQVAQAAVSAFNMTERTITIVVFFGNTGIYEDKIKK
jgi:hypothetical protein